MLKLIAPIVLTAGIANAACPVPGDLAGAGIWVRSNDDSITHMQSTGPDLVGEQTMYGPDGFWLESYKGIYVTRDVSITNNQKEPKTETVTTFAAPLSELPAAAPEVTWTGPIEVKTSNGVDEQEFSITFGQLSTSKIGACSYPSITADTVYKNPDGTGSTGRIIHLTDLGISLLVAGGELGAFYSDFYKVLEISNEPLE